MVTRAFWPAYDAGVEVHRAATARVPIEGWLRVGNGSGSALGNDNDDYALDARLDVALGRARTGVAATVPFGLRFGSGLHLESAYDRLGIAGATADGFVFFDAPTVSGPRYLTEGHVVAYGGPVKLTVEAALAKESRSKDTDGNTATPPVPEASVISKGAFAEAAWMIFGPWRRHGAWPVDSPIGVWDWGGLELGARAERILLAQGAPDVVPGGAWSTSGALRWWTTSFLAASLAVYYTRYDVAPVEETDKRTSVLGMFRVTVQAPRDLVTQMRR
jgi:phosphate-selective porin OprO/OprP